MAKKKAKQAFRTEAEVYGALSMTYPEPVYAVLPGVANATGSNARRTLDALIMGLWPSRGIHLHGVEIKCQRGDVLRELKDPEKQEIHYRYCDYFWLAVGRADIVSDDEVPENWGLLIPSPKKKGRLQVRKQAPKLDPVPIERSFLAAILRRVHQRGVDPAMPDRIRIEVREEMESRIEQLASQRHNEHKWELDRLRQLKSTVEKFEKASGMHFSAYGEYAAEAAMLKLIIKAGIHRVGPILENLEKSLEHSLQSVREARRQCKESTKP